MALNPKLLEWEHRLHGVLQQVDAMLEDQYGHEWPLHPARPPRGTTANAQYDGLFRVTASFSAGYGSEVGRGYVFRVEMVTLASIPVDVRERIEASAADDLRLLLPEVFPGQELHVSRDGGVFKIHGDLSLGTA